MKWHFVHVEKIWASNTGIRLCKTWKIPVYLEVIGTFAQEIFWIEHIMRRVPCIFCELRGRRIYGVVLFCAAWRSSVCGLSWVSALSVLREHIFPRASCRYVHKHRGEEEGEERVCVSRHSLLMHSPRYACIFISRHKRIYWLRFLIHISTLRHFRNKPAK